VVCWWTCGWCTWEDFMCLVMKTQIRQRRLWIYQIITPTRGWRFILGNVKRHQFHRKGKTMDLKLLDSVADIGSTRQGNLKHVNLEEDFSASMNLEMMCGWIWQLQVIHVLPSSNNHCCRVFSSYFMIILEGIVVKVSLRVVLDICWECIYVTFPWNYFVL
jgi:hypothetical protein